MKKILFSLAFLVFFSFAYAQEETEKIEDGTQEENVEKPKKPCALKFTGSVLFGNSAALWAYAPGSPTDTWWGIGGSDLAPSMSDFVERDNNSAVNMIGVEARVFVTDEIAIKLAGGATIYNRPQQDNVPGFYPANRIGNTGVIPQISATEMQRKSSFDVTIGGEYHFRKKNLSPYVGLALPFYYSRESKYNPYYNVDNAGNITITDIDVRHGESFGFGVSLVSGVDYYVRDNWFFGFEVKPFSFVYAFGSHYPAPGLPSAKSDMYGYIFFSQPLFKMGFVF